MRIKKTPTELRAIRGKNLAKGHLFTPSQRAKMRAAKQGKLGPLSGGWRGGSRIVKGYRKIWKPGYALSAKTPEKRDYVHEHIVVAEEKIGRRLVGDERVHHKNGLKLDNSPENLVVCENNKAHMLMHASLQEAAYILVRAGVIGFRDGRYFVAA